MLNLHKKCKNYHKSAKFIEKGVNITEKMCQIRKNTKRNLINIIDFLNKKMVETNTFALCVEASLTAQGWLVGCKVFERPGRHYCIHTETPTLPVKGCKILAFARPYTQASEREVLIVPLLQRASVFPISSEGPPV